MDKENINKFILFGLFLIVFYCGTIAGNLISDEAQKNKLLDEYCPVGMHPICQSTHPIIINSSVSDDMFEDIDWNILK